MTDSVWSLYWDWHQPMDRPHKPDTDAEIRKVIESRKTWHLQHG